MNLSTRNTKSRAPWGFALAVTAILILECFVFSKAYYLADISNFCLVYKKMMMQKDELNEDVMIFGDSFTNELDAALMQSEVGEAYSIRNSSVRDLVLTINYYLALKQYLDYQPKPKLLILSINPFFFYKQREPVNDRILHTVRRYLDIRYILGPYPRTIEIFQAYARNLLPSWNYAVFIRASLPQPLPKFVDLRADNWQALSPIPMGERIRMNERLRRIIDRTKGQVVEDEAGIADPSMMIAKSGLPRIRPEMVFDGTRDIEKLFVLAQERQIPVIFFLAPINPYKWANAQKVGYLNNLERRLSEFEKKYPVLTYFKVADLGFDRHLFYDTHHLNARGAESFSLLAIRAMDPVIQRKLKGETVQGLPARKSWSSDV